MYLKNDLGSKKLAASVSKTPVTAFYKGIIKKTLTACSLAVLLAASITGIDRTQAQAATFTIQLGQDDNFSQIDGPEQSTYMRPQGVDWFYNSLFRGNCNASFGWQQRCQPRKFDETTMNRNFLHSFDLSTPLQHGQIVSATFETRIRVYGSNDTFILGNIGGPNHASFSRSVLPFFGASYGDTIDVNQSLDLLTSGNGTSLLSLMNQEGSIDFYIEDDTMVDYIKLTVKTSGDMKATPEPTSIFGLLALGSFGVASILKKSH